MSKVSVEEGETSVRVEASKPHLVSLGGGRLSTSITIHPLDKGKTVLGSGRNVDIPVAGVGVEEVHCAIENDRGTLILTPFASLTSLDGRRVTQPTQLTQGSILGVGKTAIFRFNHPDQARMIKKSLPDKSSVPITFYPGMDGNTPHHHLESRSRDALHDLSQILAKNNFLSSPKNGDFKLNGDSSPKISLPSPSFNRDPVPYFAQKPPVKSPNAESPVHNDSKSEDYKQITIDEILNVCSEYERQMQFERSTKPVQNRIMTNGSLPREKRSPQKSPTISDPEHAPMNENKEKDVRKMHTYENISFTTGSPRPRIKTFLNKENLKENVENRIPLILDLENINEPSFHRNTDSPIYSNVNSSPKEGEKRTEALKVMKYNFLGCSPQNSLYVNGDDRMSVSPVSPSWTNPTLDVDSFPDYEILTGPEENIVRPEGGLPPDKIKELLDEKELIQKKLISLKELVKEFERQEQEMIQESAIEEALVCGELSAQDEKLAQDEKKISILKQRIVECEKSMETCLAKQEENQERFNYVKTEHLSIIETLEHKISNCQDKTLKMELKSSLVEQNDLLDRDKKSHELSEFQLLEEEAGWLSKREDLQKELNEAIERHEARKVKVATLKKSQPTLNNKFELKRIVHMKEIEEGRNRLNEINRELERLSPKKIENGTEGVIRRRAPSQDDLDRISRITSGAPIDMGDCNSLGKRTIESLQEIERNRAIHLANQGSLVIQEERQRVEELKKRVQDEVKAQWQLNRNSNCQSFTSVTSDSSLEPTRDSGVSSEEAEKAMQSDEQKMSPVNLTPESRPLSDASVYSDDPSSIKLRSKSSSNLQRPLTRYLPIQSEIDLRKHIESAGHQVDLCPHVVIDSTSCRGYLNKMSTKFNSRWNKRWFVFDRGARTFSYYADKAEKKVRGGAYFKAIEEVYVDHLNTFKSPNSKVTFVVKSSNRLYNLEAPSPEALRIWVDVIFTGAEGHLHNYT